MNRFIAAALAAGIALSGCGDGNPFEDNAADDGGTGTDGGIGLQ